MPEIKAAEQPLMDIFDDKFIFQIPPYQRPYAWTTDETGDLLDDLVYAVRGVDKLEEIPPYFLGSIVLIKDGESPTADVIDGQQRLTTLTILLCVLRELSDGKIRDELDEYVWQEGKITKGTNDVFRVTLRERDKEFFRNNVQRPGGIGPFLEEDGARLRDSQQRMFENTKYLWTKLSERNSNFLNRLAMFIIQRCYIVVVSTSDQSSAYRIFAVMNNRGLDLSPTDILKAEIIGDMGRGDRQVYTDKWEDLEEELGRDNFRDLFAHIRMVYMKDKARGTLNDEFREGVLAKLVEENFIDDVLEPYADAYSCVYRAEFDGVEHQTINLYLEYLTRLDNSDWIPPAIAYFRKNKEKEGTLLQFFRDLERLAYGMFICRANVTERISRYARVLHSIEEQDDLFRENSPLQLSEDETHKILKALDGEIYQLTRVPKPLLLRLDGLFAGTEATYRHSIVSVEHVLPQTPKQPSEWVEWFPCSEDRAYWTHRIANLVLLSRRKNSRAGNLEFEDKKRRYFQGKGVTPFALTSQVLNEENWTPEVLERRQKELIGELEKEWRLS